MEFETLVLRYRDLGIPQGETINRHKSILKSKKYVWWGWWNKDFEKVPLLEIQEMIETIKKNGYLNLFLLDSDQKEMYKASCTEIELNLNLSNRSPEGVPEYYKDTNLPCWFKFSSMEAIDISKDFMNIYTYVEKKGLFKDNTSTYAAFDNKKIYSIEEMLQQNRTIWFIRKSQRQDTSGEIKILSDDVLKHNDFSTKYSQEGGNTILLLSDLHFDSVDKNNHMAFREKNYSYRSLQKAIEEVICGEKLNIGGMIITGDLTWRSSMSEFDMAFQFVEDLSSYCASRLGKSNIAIVPGNHDICFEDKKIRKSDYSSYVVKEASEVNKEGFEKFYEKLYGKHPNEYLCSGKKIMLENGQLLDIVALNSSSLEQIPGLFQGYGYINPQQMDYAAEKMGWNISTNNAVRIVAMHHHYLPVAYFQEPVLQPNYSVLLNGEEFAKWLEKYHVQLVIHGHMHQSFYSRVSRYIEFTQKNMHHFHVLGLGSVGAIKNHLEMECKNSFCTLKVQNAQLHITRYEIQPLGPYKKVEEFTLNNDI